MPTEPLEQAQVRFTATEQRLLAVLSDGGPHTREQMMACLDDELADRSAIRVHLCRINKKLRVLHQEVVTRTAGQGGVRYQHVRLLASPNDGRT